MSKKLKWSVVVTTAPRQRSKLQTTIQSLLTAGWNDPIVFAEPASSTCDATTYTNPVKLGVFHNWIKSATNALNSNADVIMTVQDDVWFHSDSKWFAESALWPKNCGFFSLYTPEHHSIIRGKKQRWGIYSILVKSLWGAMAMIWHPSVLKQVINSKRAKNWIGRRSTMAEGEQRWKENNPQDVRNVDTFIGYCVREMKRKMYYVNPSFVQHISEYSSIGGRDATGKRSAKFMVGTPRVPHANEIPIKSEFFS